MVQAERCAVERRRRVMEGADVRSWVLRVLILGFVIAAISGASAPAFADSLCIRVGVWQPVGSQTFCAPLI